MKTKNVRLSKDITPIRYKISLKPDLANFVFSGKETIEILLLKPLKSITLHCAEIEIISAKVGDVQSKSIFYDAENETATITFSKPLVKGKNKLQLEFNGILNDKMRGFYRSKYLANNKEQHMAVTQFESTDARRAIPCFDEPSQKAIFDVELIIPKSHTAISNTVETEVLEHESGYKIVRFAPSPKMSTYLLAFIVGKFEHIEAKTKEGILIRVFVTAGKKKQAEFALQTASKILSFYENYFKIPYPLPSLDLIAIPDFAAGAMENWGAVTYRETALLVDEKLSSTANKQWVALVIAHELAHMWFGNLVTMQWWTHLWLNEGFASYIEYLAVDHLFPKWKVWTQFVFMDHARALDLDGLKNTHPIEVEVNHPREISEIFDTVSYSKGASVIRMLAHYLGEDNFQKGLQAYLKKHQFSNAKTEDLWAALEKVSKKPVRKIMKNWTGEAGYPLVSASIKKDKLELTQKRYFSSPISAKQTKDLTLWSVPIDKILLSKKTLLVDKPAFPKLNLEESSFIRIKYSPELLDLLKISLNEGKLSTEDRFGLVRDAFALSVSGETKTGDALNLLSSYKSEVEYIVWAQIISDLGTLNNLLANEKFYENFQIFCRDLLSEIVKKVGWEKKSGEDHSITLLRPMVLSAMGKSKDKKIIEKAKSLFKTSSKLDADLRGVVYNLVAENGGQKEYKILMKMYEAEPMQEEKDRIFRALCAFRDKTLLTQTLDFAFSDKMRAQDQFKAVAFIFSNPLGQDLAWKYVQKNWNKIVQKFGGGHLYSRFVQPAAIFANEKKAQEIEKFFSKNAHEGLERTIAQVTEQIRSNTQYLQRDRKNIADTLKNW